MMLDKTTEATLTAQRLLENSSYMHDSLIYLRMMEESIAAELRDSPSDSDKLQTFLAQVSLQKDIFEFSLQIDPNQVVTISLFGTDYEREMLVVLLLRRLNIPLALRVMRLYPQISYVSVANSLTDVFINDDHDNLCLFIGYLEQHTDQSTFEIIAGSILKRLIFDLDEFGLPRAIVQSITNRVDFKCRAFLQMGMIEESFTVAKGSRLFHLFPLIAKRAHTANLPKISEEIQKTMERIPQSDGGS